MSRLAGPKSKEQTYRINPSWILSEAGGYMADCANTQNASNGQRWKHRLALFPLCAGDVTFIMKSMGYHRHSWLCAKIKQLYGLLWTVILQLAKFLSSCFYAIKEIYVLVIDTGAAALIADSLLIIIPNLPAGNNDNLSQR